MKPYLRKDFVSPSATYADYDEAMAALAVLQQRYNRQCIIHQHRNGRFEVIRKNARLV